MIYNLLEEIIALDRRDLERYPWSDRKHANLGMSLRNGGCMSEAEEMFQKALRLNPDNYLAARELAKIEAEKIVRGG